MRQCGTEIKAGNAVAGPSSADLWGFVDKDGSACRSDWMCAEIEWSTREAMIGRDSWVGLLR